MIKHLHLWTQAKEDLIFFCEVKNNKVQGDEKRKLEDRESSGEEDDEDRMGEMENRSDRKTASDWSRSVHFISGHC